MNRSAPTVDVECRETVEPTDRALVSVVIPAYNAAEWIGIAVRSALDQTHRELEVIVIDDGSTDGTAFVLAATSDERLRVIAQPNSGVAITRNHGITLARGAFVAFLDADDEWDPTKIARQLEAMASHPGWVAVGSLMHHISASGRVIGVTGERVGDREQAMVRAARLMPFPLSSLLVRRDVLDRVGGFDPQFAALGQVEDLELLARLASAGDIGSVNEVLGGYRMHRASASARRYWLQRMGARYLAARQAALASGKELSYTDYLASRGWWSRVGALRRDVGAYAYRSAGIAVADERLLPALVWAVPAVLLTPSRVARRLARQRGRLRTPSPPRP
jgi:glycosyltransferase involved in cell wall biosynthesis